MTYVPRRGPTKRYEPNDASNAAFILVDHAGAGNALRALRAAPMTFYTIVGARGRVKIKGNPNAWKSRELAEGAMAVLSTGRKDLKVRVMTARECRILDKRPAKR